MSIDQTIFSVSRLKSCKEIFLRRLRKNRLTRLDMIWLSELLSYCRFGLSSFRFYGDRNTLSRPRNAAINAYWLHPRVRIDLSRRRRLRAEFKKTYGCVSSVYVKEKKKKLLACRYSDRLILRPVMIILFIENISFPVTFFNWRGEKIVYANYLRNCII